MFSYFNSADFDKYIHLDDGTCKNVANNNDEWKTMYHSQLQLTNIMYPVIKRFLSIYKYLMQQGRDEYQERFEHLCRYLIKSLESDIPKFSYSIICLQKDYRYINNSYALLN